MRLQISRWIWVFVLLVAYRPLGAIDITRNEAIPDFPREIRFVLEASSASTIESAELEFGTEALACGQATTRAFPEDFTPSNVIRVEWLWDLRRTGALPPGTVVWWRWTVRNASGGQVVTETQRLTFRDERVSWRTVSQDTLTIYWHEGSTAFAEALLEAGNQALVDLEAMTGVTLAQPANAYIYASSEEMQSATLFAPGWSGGLAFPRYHTVLLGVGPESLDWGRRALAHELAHVVIGAYTFSCVDSTPPWVSEGLAMAAEGEVEPSFAGILNDAIAEDKLLSVRSLGSIFSEDPDLALLAYAQSRSLVDFLTERYGQAAMLELLGHFRDGLPEDQALMAAFGLDRDGLESAWRAWIGAAPLPTSVSAGATPTRTPYPTFVPITGPASPATETPCAVPPTTPDTISPPRGTVVFLVIGLTCAGVVALVILVLWVARRSSRARSQH
ncbi:MAG: peptidase MA family metallohydrolase [Chloroflexota bacterium]